MFCYEKSNLNTNLLSIICPGLKREKGIEDIFLLNRNEAKCFLKQQAVLKWHFLKNFITSGRIELFPTHTMTTRNKPRSVTG